MQLGQRVDALAHVAAAEEWGEGVKLASLELAPAAVATDHQSFLHAAASTHQSTPAAADISAGHAMRGDKRGSSDSWVVILHHVIVEEGELLGHTEVTEE